LCLQINTSANSHDRRLYSRSCHVVGYFQTMPQLINSSTDLDVDSIRSSLDSQVDHFNARGSGFTIERILEFTLVITKYYHFTDAPTFQHQNIWKINNASSTSETRTKSVFYGRYFPVFTKPPSQRTHRTLQTHKTSLKVSGIELPMSPKQIPFFEDKNPEIAINLYAVDPVTEDLAFTV